MAQISRHQPDPSEVLRHVTEMFMATLNPYFAWAVARLCYEEELDLPHEVLIYFGTVATLLIGKDSETDLSLYEVSAR